MSNDESLYQVGQRLLLHPKTLYDLLDSVTDEFKQYILLEATNKNELIFFTYQHTFLRTGTIQSSPGLFRICVDKGYFLKHS